MNEIEAYLALIHTPGLGPRSLGRLLKQYSAIEISQAPHRFKKGVGQPDRSQIRSDLAWLDRSEQHHILIPSSSHYPAALKEIADPPLVLFLRGSIQSLHHPMLAIVGSRNSSAIGRQDSYRFAAYLAQNGLAIISGLALGIDGAAHQGALSVQGLTLAVLATGVDSIYPSQHQRLAEQIIDCGGALLSESPLGTPPKPYLFPARNRIISGLALGVLVIEASLKSGSLITASKALDQNKEIFARPGSIHDPLAKGCHYLIKQGAKLVENSEDILVELLPQLKHHLNPAESSSTPVLSQEYQRLLHQMGYDPVTMDELLQRTDFSAENLSAMLLWLELEGYIIAEPGGRFIRQPQR